MLLAAGTDRLDGWAARKFRQTSEWGRILDPLADKVAVGVVLFVLLVLGDIPAWYVALGLGRDLLIAVGGFVVRQRTGVLLPSNEFGKWTVGSIGLALFVIVLGFSGVVVWIMLWLSTVMMVVSLFLYARRAAEVTRTKSTK